VFSRILDAKRGGYWQIAPEGPFHVHQAYRDRTNLLNTIFVTPSGMVTVTDFMPAYQRVIKQHARLHNEPRVIRIVECLAGSVRIHHRFQPRPNFGRVDLDWKLDGANVLHADAGGVHLCLSSSVELTGQEQEFRLETGEAAAFSLRAARAGGRVDHGWSLERARRMFRDTRRFWWQWVGQIHYDGPYQQHVWRSALALKLMTYAPTGAIVAAPTTSLPERIGGDRNWDYRFTWLRDAAFTLYALSQLQLHEEAGDFFQWLTHRHVGEHGDRVPNLFDLSGVARTTETELTHLSGYRGSRPVRVGNAATGQLQLDVYGEVLDAAYIYARFGGRIPRELWRELCGVVEMAVTQWEQPDSSIWEVRSERRHFTYSKLMCWVAVDRGLRIAERFGLPHDSARWRSARRAIHRRVTEDGWNAQLRAFTQTLGGDALDAAVLRMSQTRFLRDRDPRMIDTVQAIQRHLTSGVLVRRYRNDQSPDGLTGDEGAFLMTSFWLADALAHIGELEQAERCFEQLLTFASPVGLLSEEVDPGTGHLLGNYPQAFTHLSLVGAAVNIERLRHGRLAVHGLKR
jgi:GH15 family glucan-1,4-alpha-glucosidase